MNKTHQQPGIAQIFISGPVKSELAKLRRHIEKLHGRKVAPNVYHMTCMGLEDLSRVRDNLLAKGVTDTSMSLTYITALQASKTIVAHGKPGEDK